jgi:hypothetical protein
LRNYFARLSAGHFFAWLKKITRSPAGEQPETASLTPLRSRDAKTAREAQNHTNATN